MPSSNFQPIRSLDLQKPTDLDLYCLQRQGISGFSTTRVKLEKVSIGHGCPRQNAIQKKGYICSQGQIIHKPNKQELSSMFIKHRLNVIHASVNFHKYVPYGLGVMAHT